MLAGLFELGLQAEGSGGALSRVPTPLNGPALAAATSSNSAGSAVRRKRRLTANTARYVVPRAARRVKYRRVSLWVIGAIGAAIFVAAVVPGMLLWWPTRHDRDARGGFGVSLVTGAVVALAIFALQILFELRLDRVDQQRQKQADQSNLELTIGLQKALPGIQLAGQEMDNFYFYGKNLRDANLAKAQLDGATFTGSDLACADFSGAVLTNVTAQRADLRGTVLTEANLADAILSNAHRRGAGCSGGDHTKLDDALLTDAVLDNVHLEESSFKDANLRGADLHSSHLERSDFTKAHLNGADLEHTDLSGSLLLGADLTGAQVGGAKLAGATYDSQTRWPAGFKQKRCSAGQTCTVR
jgi:uncharacterized protein YjbI with pentapeptide repeats